MKSLRNFTILFASLVFGNAQPQVSNPDGFHTELRDCLEPGDINLDGYIDVLDIVALVGCILGTYDDNCECGDVNGDGRVDILDVVSLIPPLIPMSN